MVEGHRLYTTEHIAKTWEYLEFYVSNTIGKAIKYLVRRFFEISTTEVQLAHFCILDSEFGVAVPILNAFYLFSKNGKLSDGFRTFVPESAK